MQNIKHKEATVNKTPHLNFLSSTQPINRNIKKNNITV